MWGRCAAAGFAPGFGSSTGACTIAIASLSITCARVSVRVFPRPVAASGDEHQCHDCDDQPKLALVLAQARRRAAQNMGKLVLLEAMSFGGFHEPFIIFPLPSALFPRPSALSPLHLPCPPPSAGCRVLAFADTIALMRFRTWPVVAIALLGLLALIVVSILAAQRKADIAYAHLDSLNARYRDVETRLRRLRSGLHLSGILVRDYLLDSSTPPAEIPLAADGVAQRKRTP